MVGIHYGLRIAMIGVGLTFFAAALLAPEQQQLIATLAVSAVVLSVSYLFSLVTRRRDDADE